MNLKSKTYTIEQIAEILRVHEVTARKFCINTRFFPVRQIGRNTLIHKESFDAWLGSNKVYLVSEAADLLGIELRTMYNLCKNVPFCVIKVNKCLRIPSDSFDRWIDFQW